MNPCLSLCLEGEWAVWDILFCRLLFIFYIMYSYCYVCSVLGIAFHCVVLCTVCVYMCTVLYCTVLYCTVLYSTVLYCTVLYCTVLYCTVLYCTTATGCQHNCSQQIYHFNLKFKLVCTAFTNFNDGICGSTFGKVFVFHNMTWPNLTSKYWSGFLTKINFSRSFSEFSSDKFL